MCISMPGPKGKREKLRPPLSRLPQKSDKNRAEHLTARRPSVRTGRGRGEAEKGKERKQRKRGAEKKNK